MVAPPRKMKEYFWEAGEKIDLKKLKTGFIPQREYILAHRNLSIFCHDVIIEYQGGILMIERDNEPMKGERWIIGGRVERGLTTEESLKIKTKKECGLDLHDIKYLGSARIFNSGDPFRHGRGTDAPVFVYFAHGSGELNLDNLHKKPAIVTKERYKKIRAGLHPYIQDFIDEAIKLI